MTRIRSRAHCLDASSSQRLQEDIRTVYGGPHLGGDSQRARDRYAREAKTPPLTNVHHLEEKPFKSSRKEAEEITFTAADGRWVHHPHNDPLVITTTIGNMNVHRTLVDNGSSVDILYLKAYEQMGIGLHKLTPTPTPLYGFTGDSLIPVGSVNLALTVGTYPRIATVMANFLVVDCPSAFNAVLGRPTLKELRAITSIHHLLMKFPTSNGVGEARGCQSDARECYNNSLRTAGKSKKPEQALVVSEQRPVSTGPMSEDLDPRQLEDEPKTGPVEDLIEVAVSEQEPTRMLKLGKNLSHVLKEKLACFLRAKARAWS